VRHAADGRDGACAKDSRTLKTVVGFDGTANHDAELDRLALEKPCVRGGEDRRATTWRCWASPPAPPATPKATMHFHRDLLIIADGYAKEVLGVTPEDVFVGSPPLGLHLRAGRAGGLSAALRRGGGAAGKRLAAEPDRDHRDLRRHRLLHRAHRLPRHAARDGGRRGPLQPARRGLGRRNPARPGLRGLDAKTGKPMLDGIGATEMLHIFISNRFDDHKPACTGKPVTGYEAKVIGRGRNEDCPAGEVGRLAVRGPTGCRYLAIERQKEYVQDGWNITGDTFIHG
jgi:2-aminobenzoate-CoA ligase